MYIVQYTVSYKNTWCGIVSIRSTMFNLFSYRFSLHVFSSGQRCFFPMFLTPPPPLPLVVIAILELWRTVSSKILRLEILLPLYTAPGPQKPTYPPPQTHIFFLCILKCLFLCYQVSWRGIPRQTSRTHWRMCLAATTTRSKISRYRIQSAE